MIAARLAGRFTRRRPNWQVNECVRGWGTDEDVPLQSRTLVRSHTSTLVRKNGTMPESYNTIGYLSTKTPRMIKWVLLMLMLTPKPTPKPSNPPDGLSITSRHGNWQFLPLRTASETRTIRQAFASQKQSAVAESRWCHGQPRRPFNEHDSSREQL